MRQKPFEKDTPLDSQQIESALEGTDDHEQPETFDRDGEVKKKL
jgi:hypothetical protein